MPAQTPADPDRRFAAALVALLIATGAAYLPALDNGLVAFDDPDYLLDPHVTSGLSLANTAWAFTTFTQSNWHPLTWLSLQADATLFGPATAESARAAHAVSLALHLLAGAVLALALRRVCGALVALGVAAVFLLPAIHVESVAWAAERKDVLSGLFVVVTFACWCRYARGGGARFYLAALAATALSLLAKPTFVSAPLLLLLLDVWPLQRVAHGGWRRAVVEKAPFAVLSLALCAVALRAQVDATETLAHRPLAGRVANALVSLWRYGGKLVWPHDLVAIYPHPSGGWPAATVALAGIALVVVVALAARMAVRGRPALLVGVVGFVVALVPMLGIVQVGRQAMADRYAYVPSIVLALGVLGALDATTQRRRAMLGAALACACVVWTVQTRAQVRVWRDTESVFEHARAHSDDNFYAAHVLAGEALVQGQADRACALAAEAVRLDPTGYTTRERYARALLAAGRADEALRVAQAAAARAPFAPFVLVAYARALEAVDARWLAIETLEAAIVAGADPAVTESDIGALYFVGGRVHEAVLHLAIGAALAPDDPKLQGRLTAAQRLGE